METNGQSTATSPKTKPATASETTTETSRARDEDNGAPKMPQDKENLEDSVGDEESPKSGSNSELISKLSCHKCHRSLAKSRHLIDVAGRSHRWHSECFNCDICQQPLDQESSCHIYKDKILCRQDYLKLRTDFSPKCSRCRWPIGPSDWVRRAASCVYHLVCFSCDACSRQLNTGEQFAINGNQLLCRLHFAIDTNHQAPGNLPTLTLPTAASQAIGLESSKSSRGEIRESDSSDPLDCRQGECKSIPSIEEDNELRSQMSSNFQCSQMATSSSSSSSLPKTQHQATQSFEHLIPQRHKFRDSLSHHELEEMQQSGSQNYHANLSSSSSSSATSGQNLTSTGGLGAPSSSSVSSKSKRVRTTFTEDQLSYLQKQFQVDSNPDGQDLERIATITGLSKRVTQVWFQNSRARQKKYLIKRKPIGGSSSGVMLHYEHQATSGHQARPVAGSSGEFRRGDEERRKWVTVDSQSNQSDNEEDDDDDYCDPTVEAEDRDGGDTSGSSSGETSTAAAVIADEDQVILSDGDTEDI